MKKFLTLLLFISSPAYADRLYYSHDIVTNIHADYMDGAYTKYKLVWGEDGTANSVSLANPWPIQGTVTVQGGLSPVPNTNGSIYNNVSIGTSAVTISVPANAVGFLLEAESNNTDNIRWAVGSAASSTVGNLYEPGRDSGFIPMAHDISVIALSGTQSISVQWVLSQ